MKNESEALRETIRLLENQQTKELIILKEQLHLTYESLRPINLLKNTFTDVTSSPDLQDTVVNNVIGLTTGYLSKKVLLGSSHNPIKSMFGTLLQFGVANVVSNHSETIKAIGEVFLRKIFVNRGKSKILKTDITVKPTN
ncbi:hypothetical protein EMA8858_04084 [Emticicia aquatica]|uniref:DUF4806 domain-containing protein n=1 Tax=Emticicia aquatica TaxID=1681835 RepID=A0ABM9AV83_9BACT|nr:hypothetical protein [Emticicia aquatica]CAH0997949.1 hypothetical protein EMA8858_04084 [Emticicia aquatica]